MFSDYRIRNCTAKDTQMLSCFCSSGHTSRPVRKWPVTTRVSPQLTFSLFPMHSQGWSPRPALLNKRRMSCDSHKALAACYGIFSSLAWATARKALSIHAAFKGRVEGAQGEGGYLMSPIQELSITDTLLHLD